MYYLLEKQSLCPSVPSVVLANPNMAELLKHLFTFHPATLTAIDLETRGTDATDPTTTIVGLGVCDGTHSVYINMVGLSDSLHSVLREFLANRQRLIAFNVLFDASFLYRYTGKWLNWVGDSYGLFKQLSGEGFNGQSWSLETAEREILGWPVTNKETLAIELKARSLKKADMWQLPSNILGPYCCEDTEAALQLWNYLHGVCNDETFHMLLDFHCRVYMKLVELLVIQQHSGIHIDQDKLTAYHSSLSSQIDASMQQFLQHPDVSGFVKGIEEAARTQWRMSEPTKLTKGGKVSERWLSWSKSEAKYLDDNKFNPNSKQQLETLFYKVLGHKITKMTETGRASVDKKVLPTLGEPGRLLSGYNKLVKEQGYVSGVLDHTRKGRLHPQFNSVGTVTGRLSGSGGVNVQQMPKTRGFLECWTTAPDRALVQLDIEALEPTVLAAFSGDTTLMKLYGPNANPNHDVYLFNGAHIKKFAPMILPFYDLDNPKKEALAVAKKELKKLRGFLKLEHLARQYGAGVAKIHASAKEQGYDFTFGEVSTVQREMKKLYRGVYSFAAELETLWENNNGWVLSILGCPIAVSSEYLKDIVNRVVQTSGHQILMLFIWNVDKLVRERNIDAVPWLVDFHDETIWSTAAHDVDRMTQAMADAMDATNNELGMDIKIKGKPLVARTFADIKSEQ